VHGGSGEGGVRACTTAARDVLAASATRSTRTKEIPLAARTQASASPVGPAPTITTSVVTGMAASMTSACASVGPVRVDRESRSAIDWTRSGCGLGGNADTRCPETQRSSARAAGTHSSQIGDGFMTRRPIRGSAGCAARRRTATARALPCPRPRFPSARARQRWHRCARARRRRSARPHQPIRGARD
jgi:hypothetical protein